MVSFCGKHVLFVVLKTPQRHMPKHIEGGPGAPRRAKRARGSALGHPGRGHVEMRGVPGPSGCGARDPVSALAAHHKAHALAHTLCLESMLCPHPHTHTTYAVHTHGTWMAHVHTAAS
jgi:hypothetical protein